MDLLQPDEVRRLAELGLLAGACGDLKAAKCIADALALLRPDRAVAPAVLALAHLNRRQHDEALRVLDQGLQVVGQEHRPDLLALRALALHLAGRPTESERNARAAGDHPLALALLEQAPPASPWTR